MRNHLVTFVVVALVLAGSALGEQNAQNRKVNFKILGNTGGYPTGGTLVADAKGNLYGANNLGDIAAGGVYELSPLGGGKWQVTTVYDMLDFPNQGLAIDAKGNLYGGDTLGGNDGEGEIFKLSPNGDGTFSESSIYSFPGISQPGGPNGDLLLDSKGNIYGTTIGNGNGGEEVAFELQNTANGYQYETLYTFCSLQNCVDGLYPKDGLVADAAGNLYGTTYGGGANQAGTVYELTRKNGKWSETVLHSFDGADGNFVSVRLTIDAEGNLYGTTPVGGSSNNGTAFEVSAKGVFSTLYSFDGTGGANPFGSPTLDAAGELLGTTDAGGAFNGGTVYALRKNQSGQWYQAAHYSFPYSYANGGPIGGLYIDTSGDVFGFTAESKTFGYSELFEFSR